MSYLKLRILVKISLNFWQIRSYTKLEINFYWVNKIYFNTFNELKSAFLN